MRNINKSFKDSWQITCAVIGNALITSRTVSEILEVEHPELDHDAKFVIWRIALALESEYATMDAPPITAGELK